MADDIFRDVPSGYPASAGPRLSERFNLEKVSWGSIWAGVMVTIGMEALFLTFGIFIDAVFGGSAVWGAVWYLITMAVSFYVGAWSAARLSDVAVREISILHGLTTWGLATLSTILLIGIVLWGGLQLGTTIVLSRATGALPFTGAAAWGFTEGMAGVIWGGIMLALLTAYLGGATGLPGTRTSAGQQPNAPIRRAS